MKNGFLSLVDLLAVLREFLNSVVSESAMDDRYLAMNGREEIFIK
ncbi:MAG: hypothetical protein ACTS8H_00235 [Arsenophonus sp. NC-PE1-MAG3]